MSKVTTINPIMRKSVKRGGTTYPGEATQYSAELVKNESITIRDLNNGLENKFVIGDHAEYDSYNLSYHGPIIAIGEKTVTIICQYDVKKHEAGTKVKKHRLSLDQFAWRNLKFDLKKTCAANQETSMYI